jgi:hypothetical protein
MLPTATIQEIDRLLHEGKLSHRQIAARLNISRGTVGAIASGRRGLHGKGPVDDSSCCSLTPRSPPDRCPRCGYRVYAPCLICRHLDGDQLRTQRRVAAIALKCLATRPL